MIELRNISKKFDERIIFENTSLKIEDNKVSVLVGKSGEGKSTLFRMIMGLDNVDKGEIVIDKEHKVGLVFQSFELYPHLSVLNNLIIPQKVVARRTKKSAKEKAIKILKKLDIEYLLEKTVQTLSGGESQRLAIARTLVMDNNILLMDEPTSALDQENISNLITLIRKLSKSTTIFIITHDMVFAEKVADSTYQIVDKKIIKHSLN